MDDSVDSVDDFLIVDNRLLSFELSRAMPLDGAGCVWGVNEPWDALFALRDVGGALSPELSGAVPAEAVPWAEEGLGLLCEVLFALDDVVPNALFGRSLLGLACDDPGFV